jgi:hypothetical protein
VDIFCDIDKEIAICRKKNGHFWFPLKSRPYYKKDENFRSGYSVSGVTSETGAFWERKRIATHWNMVSSQTVLIKYYS